jgi:hypothetical protein
MRLSPQHEDRAQLNISNRLPVMCCFPPICQEVPVRMPSRPRSGTCAQAIDAFSEALRERPDDRVTMNNLFALYNVSCQQVARGG